MQSLPAWETQHFQESYEELGVGIGYRRWDSISPGKTGSYKYKKNLHQKRRKRIQTNSYILTFNKPRTPNEVKIVLKELSSTFQLPWGTSNAKNMDTTGKPVEDDRHVKRTRTTWRKIAWKKLLVQTADKIIQLKQDLALFTKKKKK